MGAWLRHGDARRWLGCKWSHVHGESGRRATWMGKGWEWRRTRCLVLTTHAANLSFLRLLRISLSIRHSSGLNNVHIGHDPPWVKHRNACISCPPRVAGRASFHALPSRIPPHIRRTFPPCSNHFLPSSTSRSRKETRASRSHHPFVRLPSSSRPSTYFACILCARDSSFFDNRTPPRFCYRGVRFGTHVSCRRQFASNAAHSRTRAHVLRSSFRPRLASVLRRRR